jgi:hypothetical protein
MEHGKNTTALKLLVAVTFIAMVTVNALANILPINGVNTGQVSNSYPNLFAPTGLTFIIWGLIYLLLAGYTLYQFGLFRDKGKPAHEPLLRKTGLVFSLSSVANAVWIFSWHYKIIPLSMALMAVILICLIVIMRGIYSQDLSRREKLFVRLPFSVYFGWITVATIANATALLVDLKWNGFGIGEPVWTIIIVIIGMLIAVANIEKNKDIAYGLVVLWAYAGIVIKHLSADGFAGHYPEVIIAVGICMAMLIVAFAYVIVSQRRGRIAQH